MSTKNNVKPVTELPVETVEETEVAAEVVEEVTKAAEEPSNITGVVVNCVSLNVRSSGEIADNILAVIPAGTILNLNQKESTSEWIKVKTESGVEGFCLRKYIGIRY